MNKTDAKKLAETITNEQLVEMFENAKNGITNWEGISSVNKGITKGTAWNILANNFDVTANHHTMAKKNMIWEFGDFLPDGLKIKKELKTNSNKPLVHQKPIF